MEIDFEYKKLTLEEVSHLINLAYLDARKNERCKHTQLEFERNLEKNLWELSVEVYNHTYEMRPPIRFIVTEPTVREVFAPMFRDRVVSHFLLNLIYKHIDKSLIYDSCSCRKGKGTLFGIKRFEHHLRSVTENWYKEAYVLYFDISGYFMHINREILCNETIKLVRKYKDRNLDYDIVEFLIKTQLNRNPLKGCIYVGDPKLQLLVKPEKSLLNQPEGIGITIGDVMCQHYSNIYLNVIDQYIKRELKCKHYIRYVDDGRLLSNDKEYLKSCIPKINEQLKLIGLSLNSKKTKIVSTKYNVDFLGAVIKKKMRFPKARTINVFKKKVHSMSEELLNGKTIADDCLPSLNSYLGHFSHFNCRKLIENTIKKENLDNFFIFTTIYKKAKRLKNNILKTKKL